MAKVNPAGAMPQPAFAYTPEAPLDCPLCPRLVAYREANAQDEPSWHNAPVRSFGEDNAELLIVGLAPGRGGANKTGRPFTGDWAGDLLYATLDKYGFSDGQYQARPDDGLRLINAMITNAVRCVPPENKPTGPEANQCRGFLIERFKALPQLKAMVCLGKVSHDNTIRALSGRLKDYVFAHGAEHTIEGPNGPLTLIDSYHCSRYNTNTGRLTTAMFEAIFEQVRRYIPA